jgi:hypothetical protein
VRHKWRSLAIDRRRSSIHRKQMSIRQPNTSRAWDSLSPPLSSWLREALPSMGFERMTPVQASTIPLFMGHKDVVVEVGTELSGISPSPLQKQPPILILNKIRLLRAAARPWRFLFLLSSGCCG